MNKNQLEFLKQFHKLYEKENNCNNNELINNQVIFIAILSNIIVNKNIFKRNKQVAEFIEDKFGLLFPVYVQKSRPLLLGKIISKYLLNSEDQSYEEELNILYKFMIDVRNGNNEESWGDVIRKIKI